MSLHRGIRLFFLVMTALISNASFAGYLPPDYGEICITESGDVGRIDPKGYFSSNELIKVALAE